MASPPTCFPKPRQPLLPIRRRSVDISSKVAEELFRKGSDQVTDAQASTRGVVPLWKSAVISSFLIG